MDFSAVAAQLNAGILLPEFIMTGTLVVVLVTDLIVGRSAARWTPYMAIAGAVASAIALFFQWDAPNPISFLGSFNGDNLSVVFRGIVALSVALTMLMSVPYIVQSGTSMTEFISILLTASLGGMLLCGANELVSIFIALETLGISSYVLTGYMKRDARSNEAALKYLLIGASSTAIFLYSVSLLYGLSGGETNLNKIALAMTDTMSVGGSIAVAISLVFAIAAMAFKISAVPFHQWTPDVYEGSPTPVVAFLSVGSKTAGFALSIRLLSTVFPIVTDQWQFIFTTLALLSMVLGNIVALAQTSMKRLLAYSSIGQAGFVMIGLVANSEVGYSSMVFYLLVYLFMNLGAFGCVVLFALRTGTDRISEYSGLYQKDPLLTLALSLCLLSLGGIPPLAGFFGKLYLFWAGWQSGLYALVLVGLLTSVASIYYYIRVVKMMVVKEPHEMSDSVKNYPELPTLTLGTRPLQVSIVVTLVVTSLAGILSNPLFTLADNAVVRTSMLQALEKPVPPVAMVREKPVVAATTLNTNQGEF